MIAVTVLVDQDRLDAVAEALRRSGLLVDEVHAGIGVVSGRVPPDRLAGLHEVDGVLSIEAERTYEL
ncbi:MULTISPECIES: hypothetical protein [Actinoplanes]|uniref:hypothetical protein n=1 Tax=Actinoplanes TaxID=1865 RepID=UPI0005F2B287|nr:MULTISPECIES: hypothetical protein [Actinoplanes]GLY03925.1 hypothetical protein Acsp01_43040 [Actinoplanes sp. NBRC 101535]